MLTIEKLSERKLTELEAKLSEIDRAAIDAAIQAGYGMVRFSEMREKAQSGDPIALRSIEAHDARHAVLMEMERRRRWHGSLKPIKQR